jgi:penicillin amidase
MKSFVGAQFVRYFSKIANAQEQLDGSTSLPGLLGDGVIRRDVYGVPHIEASCLHDVIFLQGFVHAHDRLYQLMLLRYAAGGRLGEIVGKKPDVQCSDRITRTLGWARLAGKDYLDLQSRANDSADPEQQSDAKTTLDILQAYADGINAYCSPDRALPTELQLFNLSGTKLSVRLV